MIPGSANPLLLKSAAVAGPVQIERSLRFNSSDSAYLSRTPGSAGNRKTWTWAGWVKRSYVGATYKMLFSADNGAHSCGFRFTNSPSDTIEFFEYNGGFTWQLVTTQVFRDLSAWYHIVVVFDSTQGTSTNRLKLYVNGTQVTAFGTASYPSPNYDSLINAAVAHNIGAYAGIQNFDGYLADVHFIDGQALTPSSFTEVSATTGQLVPKAYTGTFGTNGFWLKFSDNSAATAATLGNDYSGNNNDWTPNNLSVTAGAGNDSLVDTPTSYGTDTGAGGEVRGNYATFNPLSQLSNGATLSNGNLDVVTVSSGDQTIPSTLFVSSGKWYCEFTITTTNGCSVGIVPPIYLSGVEPGDTANSYGYRSTAARRTNATNTSYGATFTNGDIIGVALDLTGGTLVFYKNGVSQGTAFTGLNGTFCFAFGDITGGGATSCSVNFGQRAWAYTPPANHQPVVDTLLPAPVVAKPNTVMDAILYSGNSSTQSITSLAFSPDLVWSKCRNVGRSHRLSDAVRGSNRDIYPDVYYSEGADGSITAFTANGFNLDNSTGSQYNTSGETYVSWCWDAGSSTVTNTSGSITSQVRANASAGFSIVTYTGNGTGGATVGHGGLVNLANGMIIIKRRDSAVNWFVGHGSQGWTKVFEGLNTTNAISTTSAAWNNTSPTSTVFTLGTETSMNGNGGTFVAYCFAPVAGYSSFGSYTGNGSTDGPFVYTGFRPRWLMIKNSSASGDSWVMHDTARNTFNVVDALLMPNQSTQETTSTNYYHDILSNGFKLRTSLSAYNSNGATYIYAAFAENPFQFSRAR